ncbi:MAG: hypothetical protein EBZ49_09075 [Proteobacteria bacterium]|nr:hypothetical protein [Pseudomonadota bacterium]
MMDYLRTIIKAQRVNIKKVARGQHLLQSVIRFKMNEAFFGAKGGECPQQYHLQKNQKENQSPLKE